MAKHAALVGDVHGSLADRMSHYIFPAAMSLALVVASAMPRPSTATEPTTTAHVVRGTVLGPDGKPFDGAKVWTAGYGQTPGRWTRTAPSRAQWKQIAESKEDGSFVANIEPPGTDFEPVPHTLAIVATADGLGFAQAQIDVKSIEDEITLALVEDYPITGQIVTQEGLPAQGVTIDVSMLPRDATDIDAVLKTAARSSGVYTNWPKLRGGPPGTPTIRTDAEGRFRLVGMGAKRSVRLEAVGGGIGATRLRVITHPAPDDRAPAGVIAVREGRRESDYFASFIHIGAASRAIKGVVTDEVTGKPIEGVEVSLRGSWYARANPSVTDAEGRYEVRDVAQQTRYEMTFSAPATNYCNKFQWPSDPGSNEPLELDVALYPGIVASGRLVDPKTGEPIQGTLEYNPLFPNENWSKLGKERTANPAATASTDAKGNWQLGVLPGPGAISARTSDPRFVEARVKRSDIEALGIMVAMRGSQPELRTLQSAAGDQRRGIMGLGHAVALINPKTDAESVNVMLQFTPEIRRKGTVVDPSGKPVYGVETIGLGRSEAGTLPPQTNEFEVTGLVRGRQRLLIFMHKERGLGAQLEVTGDELDPISVQLKKSGVVTGRLIDELGEPFSSAYVSLLIRRPSGMLTTGRWAAQVGEDGRFTIKELVPGLNYYFECTVLAERRPLLLPVEFKVEPGQTWDIGEYAMGNRSMFKKVKKKKRVAEASEQ